MKLLLCILLFSINTSAAEFSGIPDIIKQKFKSEIDEINKNPDALSLIDKFLKILMSTQQFEGVEARTNPKSGALEIIARPTRKISEVNISGNMAIEKSEILKSLQLNVGDGFDRKTVFDSAQKLKSIYTGMGYVSTVITVDFKSNEDSTIGITFNIKEGPVCYVKGFNLSIANPYVNLRLNQISRKYTGRKFSAEIISEYQAEVNEYLLSNRYLNASLSVPKFDYNTAFSEVIISYQVNDPYKIEFLFKGNKQLSDEELIQAIDPQSLGQLGFNLTTEAGTRVRERYLSSGYAKASVSTQVKQVDESFRREIRIAVEEGPRVTIRKLYILGQISRPPQYYSDFVIEHSSDLISRGYYNERDIENGYKNLIIELRNQGYFRARIQSSSLIEGTGGAWVDLQISIYEGPLTEIDGIKFTGNKVFTPAQLEDVLTVKTNGPLHLNRLEESIEKLRNFYLSQGHLEMQMLGGPDSLVSYNKTNTRATINFKLFEGPRVTVNAIIVDGNDQTRHSVILRELDFEPGDTLTPENINSSITSLQRLGLFGKIEIDTFEKGTSTGPRTVIVRVNERNPGLFKFGIGLTNEYNLNARGYVGVSYRNLFGSAQSISLRLEQNKAIAPLQQPIEWGADFLENKITAGYYVPYLIKPHIDFRLNLTRSQSIIQRPTTADKFTDVQESNSADLLLEKNFTGKIKFIWTFLGFSQDKKFHVGDNPRSEENIARIGPTIDFDYRDDTFNPTKGMFTRLNLDYSDPSFGSSSTIKFVRSTATVSHYQPIRQSGWVWANSIRGGYLKNLSDNPYIQSGSIYSGVPYQQLFTLGTRSTIRGFDPTKELIPRIDEIRSQLGAMGVSDPSKVALTDFKLSGESHFYLVKSELRFPLYGTIGGVIFYDGGAVILPGFRFEDEYRDSAGFGLRFITPVGPVNFELAYKLDPIINSAANAYTESKYQFHFSIGSF